MAVEEHPGQTLRTRAHETIRNWAEERGGAPATVPGTEHGDHIGVLRLDFPALKADNLRRVSWDQWFDLFEQRGLEFVYQEENKDGTRSNFFRLVTSETGDR